MFTVKCDTCGDELKADERDAAFTTQLGRVEVQCPREGCRGKLRRADGQAPLCELQVGLRVWRHGCVGVISRLDADTVEVKWARNERTEYRRESFSDKFKLVPWEWGEPSALDRHPIISAAVLVADYLPANARLELAALLMREGQAPAALAVSAAVVAEYERAARGGK